VCAFVCVCDMKFVCVCDMKLSSVCYGWSLNVREREEESENK